MKSYQKICKKVFIPYYKDCLKRNYQEFYIINQNETLESILIKSNVL